MTRDYFLNWVTSWYELIDLCQEQECNICEDIIDSDALDEYVNADISNSDYGWRAIRDWLSEIPTEYEYYRCNGSFDYDGLDDGDFEDYKGQVLDWMDEYGSWDIDEGEEDDEDDEGEDEAGSAEPEEPRVEEDFSVTDLMSMCGSELLSIRELAARRRKEPDTLLYAG